MTRVTEFSVRDFKAVEEAEVQPGGINLVVGRNNVGKTSLLEALHLALDPSSISRFDGNLDKVVREGSKKSKIQLKYEKNKTQKRNLTFDGSNTQRYNALTESLKSEVARIRKNYSDELSKEKESEIVLKSIKKYKSSSKNTEIDRNEAYLVVDGNEYSYISHPLEGSPLTQVISESHKMIKNIINASGTESISMGFSSLMAKTNDSKYVGESPDHVVSTHSIYNPVVLSMTSDSSGEGDAIRRSRIEDFLIDNTIVDGLVDFSFDRLVFEDGDEREEIPYDFMGSGFKTLVGILWELYDQDADTEVLIIEEPAVHMHPGYVNEFTQQLLQVARQEEVQLFVTTHREDLIESFFAPPTERAHGDYLREEFQVIQLTELLTKQLDYEQAETELDELNTDLRGI